MRSWADFLEVDSFLLFYFIVLYAAGSLVDHVVAGAKEESY
jgi:hypothetical protein